MLQQQSVSSFGRNAGGSSFKTSYLESEDDDEDVCCAENDGEEDYSFDEEDDGTMAHIERERPTCPLSRILIENDIEGNGCGRSGGGGCGGGGLDEDNFQDEAELEPFDLDEETRAALLARHGKKRLYCESPDLVGNSHRVKHNREDPVNHFLGSSIGSEDSPLNLMPPKSNPSFIVGSMPFLNKAFAHAVAVTNDTVICNGLHTLALHSSHEILATDSKDMDLCP